MDLQSGDFDRILILEKLRRCYETNYDKNPMDADNLTRWGAALLELAPFQNDVVISKKMNQEAISRLEEALLINPKKHETLWYLGNAHNFGAWLTPDKQEARDFFDQASLYYQLALNEDPSNKIYRKSLEVAAQSQKMHLEMHRHAPAHGFGQQMREAAGPSTSSGAQGAKKNKRSDLIYDICGWVILAIGVATWVGFARSRPPPPPPY